MLSKNPSALIVFILTYFYENVNTIFSKGSKKCDTTETFYYACFRGDKL